MTAREAQIAKLIAKAWTNQEIANELNISLHTVKKYVTEIMYKLECRNRVEIAVKVVTGG